MRIEKKVSPLNEYSARAHALWLTGYFEIMRSGVFRKGKPTFRFNEQTDRAAAFQTIFGGILQPHPPRSSIWSITGEEAVSLANIILPYAVALTPVLKAFLSWDPQSQLDTSQPTKRRENHTPYRKKLPPQSIAGILEARASLSSYKHQKKGGRVRENARIQVYSGNRLLLKRLSQDIGGGSLYPIWPTPFYNHHVLTLGQEDSLSTIGQLEKYFLLRKKEFLQWSQRYK